MEFTILLSLVCILILLLIALCWYCYSLKQKISLSKAEAAEMEERQTQIEQALHSCNTFPWVYMPKQGTLSYLSRLRSNLYPEKLTIEYFIEHFVVAEYRNKLTVALEKAVREKDGQLNIRILMKPVDREKPEWVHALGLPVGWDVTTGRAQRLVGVIRYISKEVEQEKELKDNRDFLELTMRTANIVPWEYLMDKDLLISKTPSRTEMTKPILMSDYTKYIIHPDWREDYAHEVQAVKEGKRGDYFDYKVKALCGNSDYEWMRIVGVVISKDENGLPLRMIGSTYQIDQEMHREEQLNHLRTAEEANRLKTAFLANISHEIRTPLNAIVGFSQLLIESPEDSAMFLPIINENTQLLLKLISDILDISRIESGDMHLEVNDIDLNELIGNARSMYACHLPDEISIHTQIPAGTFTLRTDKSCLMQVLHNLLANAVKFTKEGSIVLGYNVDKNQYIRFFVRDTGVGVDPKYHAYIFERFNKVDSFVQGAGLGLAICEMIVKMLGGRIGVTSELGKGSEFWFTVPVETRIGKGA